jgi:hypothetical protein
MSPSGSSYQNPCSVPTGRSCSPRIVEYSESTGGASIGTDGSTQSLRAAGCSPLAGFQLRYVYPIAHDVRERLTVPVLPYSAIDAAGARMYRGERLSRAGTSTRDGAPVEVGGATPTPALQ